LGAIQGTVREHSGNIQGTFREHSRNIQGTPSKTYERATTLNPNKAQAGTHH
jgi:hypothetical protein